MLGELLGLLLQDAVGGVLGENHAPASLQALAGADALEQGAGARLGRRKARGVLERVNVLPEVLARFRAIGTATTTVRAGSGWWCR